MRRRRSWEIPRIVKLYAAARVAIPSTAAPTGRVTPIVAIGESMGNALAARLTVARRGPTMAMETRHEGIHLSLSQVRSAYSGEPGLGGARDDALLILEP